MSIVIKQATHDDLGTVAVLFDRYRQFYHQAPDLGLATRFIGDRLAARESVIFLALLDHNPAGFVQLYPAFSSVSARRIWILNDLYVDASARRRGVAAALMEAAETWAREEGAARLVLETMPDNRPAQALYEARGWTRGVTWHYEYETG